MTHQVDPYEVAYLRGGQNELARVIIISLVERQFLELFTADTGLFASLVRGSKQIRQRTAVINPPLPRIEQTVYTWFAEPRSTADVFRRSLPDELSPYCLRFEEHLQQQQLLRGDDEAPWWQAIAAMLGLRKRITARGRSYLEELRSRSWQESDPAPYAFAAAIAGTSALAATPLSELGAEFRKAQRQDGAGCGGFVGGSDGGGSCPGGSSCGGASGCGGGGCGGGGGGCGGGGCGGG